MNAVSGFAANMGRHAILAAVIALAPLPTAALDLTPHLGFRELEDVKIPVVELADGAAKVSFQPPAGWQVSGGRSLLTFTPPIPNEVIVELRIDTVSPADPKEPLGLDKWCRKFLPMLATQIALAGEAASPFTLKGLPSHEHTYTYAYQARRFVTSVAVVDLSPKQRLSLVVTAYPENFKATYELAVQTLSSFDWKGDR